MIELKKEQYLEAFDEIAVSARNVKIGTGMSDEEIEQGIHDGSFPIPVMEMNGMKYWRLGDMARFDLGWG